MLSELDNVDCDNLFRLPSTCAKFCKCMFIIHIYLKYFCTIIVLSFSSLVKWQHVVNTKRQLSIYNNILIYSVKNYKYYSKQHSQRCKTRCFRYPAHAQLGLHVLDSGVDHVSVLVEGGEDTGRPYGGNLAAAGTFYRTHWCYTHLIRA